MSMHVYTINEIFDIPFSYINKYVFIARTYKNIPATEELDEIDRKKIIPSNFNRETWSNMWHDNMNCNLITN